MSLAMNVHTMPVADLVEHEVSHTCICRPSWVAVWNQAVQSVVWQFVHHSLDGRERREAS